MKITHLCFISLLIPLVSAFAQQAEPTTEPPELISMRAQYEKRVKQATTPVLQEYIRGLQSLLTMKTQAGRLDDAIAVREEIQKQTAALQAMTQQSKPVQFATDASVAKQPASATAAQRKNMVANPDFEKGLDGWWLFNTDAGKSKVVKNSDAAQSGQYFVRLKKDDKNPNGGIVYFFRSLKWGDHVYATAWVRIDEYKGGQVVLTVDARDKDNKFHYMPGLSGWSQPVMATCGWTKLSVDCVLPSKEEAPLMQVVGVALEIQGEQTDEVFVDNVYVGTEPDPNSPNPQ